MMSKSVIGLDEIAALVESALTALGLDKSERKAVNDVLFYAELRGKSQGFIKIVERTVLPSVNRSAMQIEDASACVARVTANGNIGMLVMSRAAEKAVSLCKASGLALVSTCGTASSTGSIGFYAERIAAQGFIGIVMAGSPKVMALHGSTQPAMGTNPIAAAIPSNEGPLVIDMATSEVTWFDIIKHDRSNLPLPQGVAYNEQGQLTQTPSEALQGALKTFGGVKGSALALLFECLTGPLSGASMLGDTEDSRGNMLLAIDPAVVLGEQDFRDRMSTLLSRMRETGASMPGDRSRKLLDANLENGTLLVDPAIITQLEEIARSG